MWPFTKKKAPSNGSAVSKEVEEDAERRLSTVAPAEEFHLEWDDDEEITASVKLACANAEEESQAAAETLTRSTKQLRRSVKKTASTLRLQVIETNKG